MQETGLRSEMNYHAGDYMLRIILVLLTVVPTSLSCRYAACMYSNSLDKTNFFQVLPIM